LGAAYLNSPINIYSGLQTSPDKLTIFKMGRVSRKSLEYNGKNATTTKKSLSAQLNNIYFNVSLFIMFIINVFFFFSTLMADCELFSTFMDMVYKDIIVALTLLSQIILFKNLYKVI